MTNNIHCATWLATRFLIIGFLVSPLVLPAQVEIPAIFSDGMVMQRNVPVRIWGWATAGEKVAVAFNKRKYKVVTGKDKRWEVTLAPLKAGGPYNLVIEGSNRIEVKDILVGDVWLCAGQSNMFHYLELHKERYAKEIESANHHAIRQFLIPMATDFNAPARDTNGGEWKSAKGEDVLRFSVVAYFFAKHLYDRYGVPIGIINASVGGTPIEAWISENGLQQFPEVTEQVRQNRDTAYQNDVDRRRKVETPAGAPDTGLEEKWFSPQLAISDWKRINVPGYWEDQGVRNLDGVVWYRKEIELSQENAALSARLYLGRIVDADDVYVNGTKIGGTGYQYPQRRYNISAGTLRPGSNTIVVRVTNHGGKGGFVPDKPYRLIAGDDTVDLKGDWLYKVGKVFDPNRVAQALPVPHYQPSVLFNGMVGPLSSYALKGFVWYQGESNTGRPSRYAELLPALIEDWRKHFGDNKLPFVYAQLPNFMEVDYWPVESNWAQLREAQLKTLKVPNTAMAVTIDLGEWNDIHPENKKPVGERLALGAMKVAYNENVVHTGPTLESVEARGDSIVLKFSNVGSGLTTSDGKPPKHFAIAGKDKKFFWANAVIRGDRVVVRSPEVAEPLFVRYAWADNPDFANLVNKEGLPASPFRTDTDQ